MRVAPSRALFVASAAAALIACSIGALDGFSGGENDAADANADAVTPAMDGDQTRDDANVSDAPASAIDAGPCTRHDAGGKMIPAGGFCIDATEVTQKEYAAFLAAKMSQAGTQPAECAWNTSIQPICPTEPNSMRPVVGVDWCDARLYCEWAGKRLCGARKGQTLAATEQDTENATKDEWYAACSNNGDGFHAYPYGNEYAPTKCVGSDASTVADVASHPECVGGIDGGLYDMSGNAWEWQNVCTPGDGGPSNDKCLMRGGATGASAAQLRCLGRNALSYDRSGSFCSVGFRCCSDE